MKFNKTVIDALGYALPPHVVSSQDLEERLAPLYKKLHLKPGQLEALTGIAERRYWDLGYKMCDGAITAGQNALENASVAAADIGMLVYAGVCRDNLEPATACAVAHGLGVPGDALVYDVSNACLGVVNAIIQVASAIELGQIRAGIVVSCETARQIVDLTIERMLAAGTMEVFIKTLATLTGGSGAAAVVLADAGRAKDGHRLLGAAIRNATAHHRLCTWGPDTGFPASAPMIMNTDSVGVLKHGVALGQETYRAFRAELALPPEAPHKIVCHQVGETHQKTVLEAIGIPIERDFSTFRNLGNIGTVSLPLTAAVADQRGFFDPGDVVGLFGIGSGLNCLLLGVQW
ncbi:MAG: 3-oxoacyl-ACP synthase III [Pseudomonadota bacterium]